MTVPALPPGFTLDTAVQEPPPDIKLPDGFKLDRVAGAKETALDVVKQFVTNIPRGVAGTADLGEFLNPATALVRGARYALGDTKSTVEQLESVYKPPAPETRAGEYAAKAGETVGGSIIPGGTLIGTARTAARAVVPPALTWAGRLGQQMTQQAAANPAKAAALEFISAVTGSTAGEYAKGSGVGVPGQIVASLAGGMTPGIAASYLNRSGRQIGTETGRTLARQRVNSAVRDAADFDALDVRPFGPAFNQGPVASVGKQLTETPLIGAPLRNNLDETFQDMAAARTRIADEISPNATHETAGVAVQRGLDRFRDRSFHELEPTVVRDLGIDPFSPVQAQQVGGRQQIERIQQGLPLLNQITNGNTYNSRGMPMGLPQTRVQKLNTRTRIEDLSESELDNVIRTPADRTSFSTRLEALYERANRALPPLMRGDGTRDPILLPTESSRQVVQSIVGDEARTGIHAGLQGRYGDMFARLGNRQSNVTLQDLRAMRTAIGRDLSNFGQYDASLDRTQLRRLYAALSSDIEIGMQDMAVRAANATQMTGPRQLTAPQARAAAQALRDNQIADRYARAGFERMDRFLQIVQAPNPQQAAQSIIRMASDGGQGNMRQVRAAMTALRPEERSEFGSLIVRELGAPTPGARGIVQESGFSPQRFVTGYQKMSPEARAMFFSPEHQRAIDRLFNVANRISNVEALANASRSGTNAINLTGGGWALTHAASGDVFTPMLIGGSGLGLSVLMSRPAYTRWMTRYMELRAAVRDGTDASIAPLMRHLGALERQARLNPELWPVHAMVSAEIDKKRKGNPQ